MPHRLSKSRFVAGWLCPRLLWWRVHRADAPEMQLGPADLDRTEQGNEVGFLATQRWAGGVRIDLPYEQMREKVEATRAALAEGLSAPLVTADRRLSHLLAMEFAHRFRDIFHVPPTLAPRRFVAIASGSPTC